MTDRTPQPCLHKRANHQHGTRACYVLDKCRCRPCSRANSAAENWRTRQKAYGRYDRFVDAEAVRERIRVLQKAGMGLKTIGKKARVSGGAMNKLIYGTPRDDGTRRPPAKRVTRATAERIMNVAVDLAPGAKIDAVPTRTRIRALVALGWSQSKLADALGILRGNFHLADDTQTQVTKATADAVEQLYDQLSMTLPPQETQRDKIAASRARRYAKERGWLPPLALDDDTLQPLTGKPDDDNYMDEAAIERRMGGDKSVRLTKDEAAEVVRRWRASGRSLNECERITGLQPYRYKDTA